MRNPFFINAPFRECPTQAEIGYGGRKDRYRSRSPLNRRRQPPLQGINEMFSCIFGKREYGWNHGYISSRGNGFLYKPLLRAFLFFTERRFKR